MASTGIRVWLNSVKESSEKSDKIIARRILVTFTMDPVSTSTRGRVTVAIFDVLSQKQGSGDFSLLVFSQGNWRISRPRL